MFIIRILKDRLFFECSKTPGWEIYSPYWKEGGELNLNELICCCPICEKEAKEKSND